LRSENKDSGASGHRYPVRLTTALVEQIRNVGQAKGARLLVVAVCHHDDPCEEVVRGLTEINVPILALDRLKGYSLPDMVIPGDEHWNAAGHTFAAKAISEFINKHKLLW